LPSNALKNPDLTPLSQMLVSEFSEQRVPILWRGIQQRLDEKPRSRARLPMLLAAAAVVLIVGVLGLRSYAGTSSGPLALQSGPLPAALIAEANARTLKLSDGSEVEVAQQSRLDVLSNDQDVFVTALGRGEATFEVKPGGKRRWIVEAGLVSVEVVGTRFTVTRNEAAVGVEVHRGIVLVRGEGVPGGQRRLTAGQKLSSPVPRTARLEGNAAEAAKPARRILDLDAPDDEASKAVESEEAIKEPTRIRITELETESEVAARQPVAGESARKPAKDTPVPTDVEGLLAEADRARSLGDHAEALKHFEQVISLAPKFDPRRGLAAMSVARLTMQGDPARAARALRATLDGMPSGLSEHAQARLIEAYARSGQSELARAEAQRYLKRFPRGRRVNDVRRWTTQ
jgi:transmembrane sensor